MGPMSLGLIRKAFWDSFDNSYEEQLNLERDLQFIAGQSDDFKEGVKAFDLKSRKEIWSTSLKKNNVKIYANNHFAIARTLKTKPLL